MTAKVVLETRGLEVESSGEQMGSERRSPIW